MSKRDSRRRMLNFPFIYNFLEVELRGCNHDLRTMIEHFPLTVRYLIYSIPKAKCRPGHLNVNLLNIAISHSLHLQSLHHNPHYHHHQHQGDLTLGWSLNLFCDVNKDLLRSFIVNKACRFPCHFFDMFNTKPTQRLKLGTFSIDKSDGSDVLVAVAVVVAKTPYWHFANGVFRYVCTSTKSKSDVFSRHFLVFARSISKLLKPAADETVI